MIELKGKYNIAKVFTDNVEQSAQSQIITLLNQETFKDSKIRIMPDTHAGAGCVIGFTADFKDKIIPNLVGVDIGCGMHVTKFNSDINLEGIDNFIRNKIPHGNSVNKEINGIALDFLNKTGDLKYIDEISKLTKTSLSRHLCSIGSLGGGNHFIEINEDSEGFKYLVIHSGSRNFGLQVAKYFQKMAEDEINNQVKLMKQTKDKSIGSLRQRGETAQIDTFIKLFDKQIKDFKVPKELSYLQGNSAKEYLKYMQVAQRFAILNRTMMVAKILETFKIDPIEKFETIHNYIDDNMIRKGAVSAKKGEKLIIPINMRDGSIIAVGKGNEDWNYSAPHGAGRLMSRSQAKEQLDLEEFTESMKDVFTTSVKQSTLDEAPNAYKSMDEILKNIKDTVDVVEIIKPIYNFKA
jgi:RNA-splicing ligase RtcB